MQIKGIAWLGKWAWKHFPGRQADAPHKLSILERADAARPDYEYVQLADGRLVAVNAPGELNGCHVFGMDWRSIANLLGKGRVQEC